MSYQILWGCADPTTVTAFPTSNIDGSIQINAAGSLVVSNCTTSGGGTASGVTTGCSAYWFNQSNTYGLTSRFETTPDGNQKYVKLYFNSTAFSTFFNFEVKQAGVVVEHSGSPERVTPPGQWTLNAVNSTSFHCAQTTAPSSLTLLFVMIVFPVAAQITFSILYCDSAACLQGMASSATAPPDNCLLGTTEVTLHDGTRVPIQDCPGKCRLLALNAKGVRENVPVQIIRKLNNAIMRVYFVTPDIAVSGNHLLLQSNKRSTPCTSGCAACAAVYIKDMTGTIAKHTSANATRMTDKYWYHAVPIHAVDASKVFSLRHGYYSEFCRTPLSDMLMQGWEIV